MNLSYNGTINNKWETLCEKVYETYVDTHTTRKHQDWFDENVDEILSESQCGFHRSRSKIGMIFTSRQLQEKAVEQQQSLYMVFIDMFKAFDTVSTCQPCGSYKGDMDVPRLLSRYFKNFMMKAVSIGGSTTDPFKVSHGLKQGCVLAPTLIVHSLSGSTTVFSVRTA